MNDFKYKMGFTTGGLFYNESNTIVSLYLELQNWNKVRDIVISDNLLQHRTVSSLKRTCSEILSRLKTLKEDELVFLLDANCQEQGYLLWISVCRRYKFIYDFAVEVIREKYLHLDYSINNEDYELFFNRKLDWHEELDSLTESTHKKNRSVLFKILKESGIITNNIINPILLTPQFALLIYKNNQSDLNIFPISDLDIKGLIQ